MTGNPDQRGRLALFPPEEFHGRIARVRALMMKAQLDALLVTSETNHVYFSGLRSPSFATRARPITMLIPLADDPVVIVSRNQLGQALAVSWVRDIRFHAGLEPAALDLLGDVIVERGLAGARIGAELGEEQRLGMTQLGFEAMKLSLPGVAWIDAASVLWGARAIKSPREIACLREIGAILGRGYERMIALARPGAVEAEIHRAFVAALVADGADGPAYAAIHSGAGNYRRIGGPTSRALVAGDLLWADTGVGRNGYYADTMRTIAIGHATAEHERRYAIVYDACQHMLAVAKPGVPIAELMSVCRKHFAANGVELGAATRVGHGVGADLAEPPSIVDTNEQALEEGMVLAIEPSIADDDGFIGVEENFAITRDGIDLLSAPSPDRLLVVQ